jgi:outer membrane protein
MKIKAALYYTAVWAVSVSAVGAAVAAPPPAKPGGAPSQGAAPVAKVLVINQEAILRASRVGQDIVRQVTAYTKQAQNEFKGQEDGLRKDGRALQQQLAILAPDVKAKKIADFQAREKNLQTKLQQRQSLIQGGVIKARQQLNQALGPIIQNIMQQRGATLLIDARAVVYGQMNQLDITRQTVQMLDQKMPVVKVELVAPPAGLQQQPPQ